MRNSLVIFQFCISILLLLGTVVIVKQLNFIRNKEMGFNRDNILVATIRDNRILKSYSSIKNDFLQHPNISGVTKSIDLPITRGSTDDDVIVERTSADPGYEFKPYIMYVGHDFLNVFGIDLVAGRCLFCFFKMAGKFFIQNIYSNLGITAPGSHFVNYFFSYGKFPNNISRHSQPGRFPAV